MLHIVFRKPIGKCVIKKKANGIPYLDFSLFTELKNVLYIAVGNERDETREVFADVESSDIVIVIVAGYT